MITDNQMQKTLMKESFDYLNKFIALICFFTGLKNCLYKPVTSWVMGDSDCTAKPHELHWHHLKGSSWDVHFFIVS